MSTRQSGAGEQAQQTGGDIQREARRMGEQAQQKMGEIGEVARHQASELQHTLESRIREKPLNAVLIAAGVGILIGILWRR